MIALPPDRPALMAILNVTPDSFSEEGLYRDSAKAIEAGLRMLDDGADLVDVGGESTRPGAAPVANEEEMRRVAAVVEAMAKRGVVSIDTRKPSVARRALELGASIVNDVGGLRDAEMVSVCAQARCTVCIMHMQGTPDTMQEGPSYGDVVAEVTEFLKAQADTAVMGGIEKANIWIDPGIGFGKTVSHNLALLKRLGQFAELGYPVLIGVSRKSFLGRISSRGEFLPVEERLEGTLAAQVLAQAKGAKIVRAHDVKAARRAIDTAAAILGA